MPGHCRRVPAHRRHIGVAGLGPCVSRVRLRQRPSYARLGRGDLCGPTRVIRVRAPLWLPSRAAFWLDTARGHTVP